MCVPPLCNNHCPRIGEIVSKLFSWPVVKRQTTLRSFALECKSYVLWGERSCLASGSWSLIAAACPALRCSGQKLGWPGLGPQVPGWHLQGNKSKFLFQHKASFFNIFQSLRVNTEWPLYINGQYTAANLQYHKCEPPAAQVRASWVHISAVAKRCCRLWHNDWYSSFTTMRWWVKFLQPPMLFRRTSYS